MMNKLVMKHVYKDSCKCGRGEEEKSWFERIFREQHGRMMTTASVQETGGERMISTLKLSGHTWEATIKHLNVYSTNNFWLTVWIYCKADRRRLIQV